MQWLRFHISRHPKPALVLGKTLFFLGSLLILIAVFARAGLAEAYPQFRWLVPEGPVGYGVAALLVLAGMGLTVLAEKAIKGGRR